VNTKHLIIFSLALLIFFSFQPMAYSQSRQTAQTAAAFPRIEPDPKAIEYFNIGRQIEGYSWTDLAEISLWASGDVSLSNMQKIRDAVAALNSSADLPENGRERADFILAFLHDNLLRRYSLYQTRVDTVFTNGNFNCVSSAVLYIILCKSAGINTSGVMTRDHAFVIVHVDGQNIDVETTNRFGLDPGNRKEFHDQFGRLTGFSYVPARNYRDRQTINQIELISLILNNRIAELERTNRHTEAVPLAVDRTALLLGSSLSVDTLELSEIFKNPLEDLLNRLLFYGSSLLRSNREEDALHWAALASVRYPASERWSELIMVAVNNRITRFMRERRIPDARNFLESYKNILAHNDYETLNAVIIDAELLGRANQINTANDGYAVVADIEQALNSGRLAERRATELITFAVQKTAQILSAAPDRNWRAAIDYIENAISRFGANRELEQTLRTYRNNLAAEYHNRFAAEWNRQNFAEAERILNEGLAEFPDNRQLLNNRETVNRRRQ
jgi:hypothetical protein